MTSIEQAEAAGFDFAEPSAVAIGRHELALRWTDPARPAPTSLDVDVRATGRVEVTTWVETTPDPRLSSLPPCRPLQASSRLEVEVQIAAADRGVAGVFTGYLSFGRSNSDWAPPVWQWGVSGDGSSLRGDLQFPPAPPEPHRLVASINVVRFVDGDGDDRGEFGLTLWHDTHNPYPRPPSEVVQSYRAMPRDGCSPLFERVEPTPPGCEQPWTQLYECCIPLVRPVRDAGIGDAGIGDEDAG